MTTQAKDREALRERLEHREQVAKALWAEWWEYPESWEGSAEVERDKFRRLAATAMREVLAVQASAGAAGERTVSPPTPAEIDDACMWFRHDFGLLDDADAERLRFEAREWLRAWIKVRDGAALAPAAEQPGEAREPEVASVVAGIAHELERLKYRTTGRDPKLNGYEYAEVPAWLLRQWLAALRTPPAATKENT